MARLNKLGLAYSIKRRIEQEIPAITGHIRHSGMEKPTELPYVVVSNRNVMNLGMSKRRESTSTTYAFQIDLFADTYYELDVLQDHIERLFLYDEFTYYTRDGVVTDYRFMIDDEDFMVVPLYSDDSTDETSKHSVHFDVKITSIKHKNRGN